MQKKTTCGGASIFWCSIFNAF